MQQGKLSGKASKYAQSGREVRRLVRLERRDLGSGAAGLSAVRGLVIAGGAAGAGAVEGEGGGSRFARGGEGGMGLGRRNLV
jgi:hypothetical protein